MKTKFCRSALFDMKTTVSPKYFVNDCSIVATLGSTMTIGIA